MNYEKYVKNKFDEYINKSDWRVKENSNSFFSFGALNKHMVGKDSALIWKDYYDGFDKRIIESHNNGDSHIHDLGSVSSYCFGASLKDLLLMGVTGVPNVSVSAPAKRLRTITSQIANIMTIFQNETAGAIAYSSWNSYLAPFLYFDKLERDNLIEKSFGTKIVYNENPYDKKINIDYNELDLADITESVQNMIFALNSNSRAGAEPSFSNLTLDFKIPEPMKNLNVIINGKEVDNFKYKDFQKECDILTSVFSKIMLKGDAHGNAMSYPIPTFNIGKQMDWDNPYYENVWEMSAKYGLPYFGNFVQGNLKEDDVYSMCCFRGDEKFISNKGVKSFNSFEVGETIMVPTHTGEWKKATVNTYGEQFLNKVTIRRGRILKEIFVTDNHEWILKNGITTNKLKKGDILCKTPNIYTYNWNDLNSEQKELWCKGFLLGDGVERDYYSEIRLCGDKIKFSNRFIEAGHSVNKRNSTGEDLWVYLSKVKKEIPKYKLNSTNYNIFIDGLLSADGWISKSKHNKYRAIQLTGSINDDVYDILNMGGQYVSSIKDLSNQETNYGKRSGKTIYYQIQAEHSTHWNVIDIQKTNISETVWCLDVEDNHSFILDKGVVTGNCRLRLDKRELINKTGGLFGAGEKTGSMGVYTINLPNIAFRSKDKSKSVFFNDLLEQMEIGKKQLIFKKRLIKYLFEKGLYPALKKYLVTLDTLFLTIGIIGANEMCLNYLGEGIETENGRNFTIEVMNFMRDKLADFQEETGELFNLEFSPAEGASYRLAKKSKERYPNIITAGKDEVYFTNSVHLPVGIEWSYKDIYTHQNELLSLATGGSVYHNYLKERLTGEMVKNQIRIIFDNWDIPYLSNSPLYSICEKHGYLQGYNDICPICGASTQNYQRVTGYVRMVSNFNKGKAEEFRQRNQKECDILETK